MEYKSSQRVNVSETIDPNRDSFGVDLMKVCSNRGRSYMVSRYWMRGKTNEGMLKGTYGELNEVTSLKAVVEEEVEYLQFHRERVQCGSMEDELTVIWINIERVEACVKRLQ